MDADTGDILWETKVPDSGTYWTSPAITEDLVIVASKQVVALDRHTGDIVWSQSVNVTGEVFTIEASYYTQFVNANGDHLTLEALYGADLGLLSPDTLSIDAEGNITLPYLQYVSDPTVIHDPVSGKDLIILGLGSEQNFLLSVKSLGYFHPETGTTGLIDISEMNAIGRFAAFDLSDGSLVWDTPTLDAASGASGGGSWASQAYDPVTNVLYMGVGQMHRPPNPDLPPPAFDYSDSIVAINASTGEVIDHVQFNSGDVWGYDFYPTQVGFNRDMDVNLHPQLFTQKIRGEDVQFVGTGDKEGEYHVMQILSDGSMKHVLSMKFDPASEFGGLQATPTIHDGVLTITSHAALQYTDPVTGESYLVDPGTVDPTGTVGFRLIHFGDGFLLPEIFVNPEAVPVLLADTERVSLNEAILLNGFNQLAFSASGKTTSVDLNEILKTRNVYKRMELEHSDNGNVHGDNLEGAFFIDFTQGSSEFIRYVNLSPALATGPATVVGPSDNDPTNDIVIQTFVNGLIKAFDSDGNVLFSDMVTAPNSYPLVPGLHTANLTGGITVDNDGDLYIGYGILGPGGIVKYSLPDNVTESSTSTSGGGELLGIASTSSSADDDSDDIPKLKLKKK